MTLSQLKELPNEELNRRVAEVVGHDLFVIVKRGYYYRPNACGYTGSLAEAWKLPLAQAKKYEMYADRTDVAGCEKVLLEPAPIPNYAESLDAIAEAEKTLSEADFHRYKVKLALICGDDFWESDKCTHWSADPIVALARQRAIAFLAVRGREG